MVAGAEGVPRERFGLLALDRLGGRAILRRKA
jgi:hypothetical protein